MKQDRISGVAIIVGSLLAVLTMALHPVGGSLRNHFDYLQKTAPVITAVHVLALWAIAVQTFGLLGLHRALGPASAHVRAGLVAYVVAWIAVFGAALTNGLVTWQLIRRYPRLEGAEQAAMNVLWEYNGMVNHALDWVWIVATCLGTLFWSLATWRHGRAWRAASVFGLAVAAVGILSLLTGHLHMNVTGVGLFVFGYSTWAVAVGALLCRSASPSPA